MDKKNLIRIIPIFLIIGFIIGILIGFKIGVYSMYNLDKTIENLDECSIETLNYVMEHNTDCKILISGYLRDCINNKTNID